MPERTAGGLFLPDEAALAMIAPEPPAFAAPIEPTEQGLAIDAGFASAYFVTDPARWLVELDDPLVTIATGELVMSTLIQVLESAARTARPILVVARTLSREARALLVINKLRGTIFANAIETTRGAEIASYLASSAPVFAAKRVSSGIRSTVIR